MELGLIIDFRQEALEQDFKILLTKSGQDIYDILQPMLKTLDLTFNEDGKAEISWSMNCENTINETIKNYLNVNTTAKKLLRSVFLKMDAVNMLLKYLYSIQRKVTITKAEVYADFFEAPFVKSYLERYGLESPTENVIVRRVPFLFNILESLGIINQGRSNIQVLAFIPAREVIKLNSKENDDEIDSRISKIVDFNRALYKTLTEEQKGIAAEPKPIYKIDKLQEKYFSADELSLLKESFGRDFLTENYYLQIEEI
jgi:hypothetical protein